MASLNLQIDTGAKYNASLAAERSPIFKKFGSGNRAQEESRKLLSHLLAQLESRRMPPPVYDAFKDLSPDLYDSGLTAVLETVRGAVRMKRAAVVTRAQTMQSTEEIDSDSDADDDVFSTDFTLDLLTQLEDVLIISIAQNWQIFEPNPTPPHEPRRSRPASGGNRLSRSKSPRSSGLNFGGRGPGSASPAVRARSSDNLLQRCIAVLSSICLEDCRFKVAHPRPSRPPFSLQALTLDVALYLITSHRKHPTIVTKVSLAMLPALSSFPSPLQQRLLGFFENVFRTVLEDLRESRNMDGSQTMFGSSDHAESFEQAGDFSVSIQVEEVNDPTPEPLFQPWSRSEDVKILATTTAGLDPSIYHLASLCTPFISMLLHVVDITQQSPVEERTLAYISRILNMFMDAKFDMHSNLLEVIAYGSARARSGAITILNSIWPLATGHVIVSRAWLLSKHMRLSSPSCRHEFVPWNFVEPADCGVCTNAIRNFGLCCPFCNLFSLHFGCFDDPEGTRALQYSDENTGHVSSLHFSFLNSPSHPIQRRGHAFFPAHFLSLTLCHLCHEPLWGVFSQGSQCQGCWQAMHPHCADRHESSSHPCGSLPTSEALTVTWSSLRKSFVSFYSGIASILPEMRTYEEVAVIHATLFTQLEILTLGISSGSIVVTLRNGKSAAQTKDFQVDPFELHRLLDSCELCLKSQSLPRSPAIEDFMEENSLELSTNFLCLWSGLLFVVSTIKAPLASYPASQPSTSDKLLQVSQSDEIGGETIEPPYQAACIAHLRDALGYEFGMHSDAIARLMLERLYFLGFYRPLNPRLQDPEDVFHPRTQCHFPLPLGLDISPDVETLASAVEACLDDIDVSINEFGFLQLVRRFPCSGLVSDYALSRMAGCVVGWILNEDTHLATVLRNVTDLPGVRSRNDPPPWPSRLRDIRPSPGSSAVNNGGDYVATRRSLLALYALPWLRAVHDRDPISFGKLVFDFCMDDFTFHRHSETGEHAELVDQILQKIIKLAQSSALFSTFDFVLMSWLRLVSSSGVYQTPMPSLYRLFPREYEAGQRWSSASEVPGLVKETVGSMVADPWESVQEMVSQEGTKTAVQTFSVFARSGVDIPVSVFSYLGVQLQETTATFEDALVFTHALLSTIWLQPKGRDTILDVLLTLHAHFREIVFKNVEEMRSPETLQFIRQSFAVTLLLYGCDRAQVESVGLVVEADIVALSSRRRHASRNSTTEDPVVVNTDMMRVIGDYVLTTNDQLSVYVARFLSLFLASNPLLEPHEIDNFILQNSDVLSNCAWQFYSLDNMIDSRSAFLLRILTVDHRPFIDTVRELMRSDDWEARFITVGRLFRIVLDVTGPSFQEAEGQWQPNVLEIFYTFFEAMWQDRTEDVRLEVEACSSNLLPTHFNALSRIWDLAIPKLPQDERLTMVSFMIQLHPHFPKWQMLSWSTILESLHDIREEPALSSSSHTLTQDISNLRVAVLILSLQMIADGVHPDNSVILQIKVHVLDCLGFRNVSANMTPRGLDVRFEDIPYLRPAAIPLVTELLLVLDSSYRIPSSHSGTLPLVGLHFVDLVLSMFSTAKNLASLPTLPLKSLLEALGIIIQKHDFDGPNMRFLQPLLRRSLTRTIELLLENPNYDLCQMCLTIMTAFMESSVSSFMGGVISHSLAAAAHVVETHSQHRQDALIAQAKAFISGTLRTFAAQGVFLNLLRRSLDVQFFHILREILVEDVKSRSVDDHLRESLLRDSTSRLAELESRNLPGVLKNLERYITIVFHREYSKDLIAVVATQLAICSRRLADFPQNATIASPFLAIPTLLIQHNRANCRDMLVHLENILRNVMSRLPVEKETLTTLLNVTASLNRRGGGDETLVQGNIFTPLKDVLFEGLRCRAPVAPVTVSALVKVLLSPESPHSLADPQLMSSLIDPCLTFLQVHRWTQQSESDLESSTTVAKVLFVTARHDPGVVGRLNEQDKSRPSLTLRTWNVLLLATLLEDPVDERWMSTLFAQFSAFNLVYVTTIRSIVETAPETAVIDINHVYICVKLWLLFACHRGQEQDKGDVPTLAVWNQLWPAFESLVRQYERDARKGISSPTILFTFSSCADLLGFVHNLQCPVGMYHLAHLELLQRLKGLKGSPTAKVSRAVKAISEAPHGLPTRVLLTQIGKDLVAAEKLRMLEQTPQSRTTSDRSRHAS